MSNDTQSTTIIGIIGGGQLGKMLMETTDPSKYQNKKIKFMVYSFEEPRVIFDAISQIKFEWIQGDLQDYQGLVNFCNQCDLVTIEIENVNIQALKDVKNRVPVYPSPDIIEMIQNKKTQKEFFYRNQFPTAKFISYQSEKSSLDAVNKILSQTNSSQVVNKLQIGGYDGKGVKIVNQANSFQEDLFTEPSIVEEMIDIHKELSVIIARNLAGETIVYDPVEMVFNDQNMLDYLVSPANLEGNTKLDKNIKILAINLANKLNLVGVLAIEMFLTKSGQILINELAPRPHNSGHHQIDCYNYSQYDLLIKCLLNQSLGEISLQNTNNNQITIMVNLLGHDHMDNMTSDAPYLECAETFIHTTGFKLYDYRKISSKPNRKMGHLTYNTQLSYPIDNQKIFKIATRLKVSYRYGFDWKTSNTNAVVGVIMGSSSDLPIVKEAITILRDFQIPYEVKIVSAHRTPYQMSEYAKLAQSSKNMKVLIAAAGGAAHLPGMVASMTTLPVIGIPIKSTNSMMNGLDSLFSIAQMPAGIPVATMATNGAKNAGLMAVRILATSDQRLRDLLDAYQLVLEDKVDQMNQSLNY